MVALPTVSLEALCATLVVDTNEVRDFVTFNVPGKFLHSEIPKDKKILIRLRNEFFNIMWDVNPQY